MAHLEWTSYLKRLEYNLPLALELSQDFMQGVDARVQNLDLALHSSDFKKIEYAAHYLRGFIAPYGGGEIMSYLKILEEDARREYQRCFALPVEFLIWIREIKEEMSEKIGWLEGALRNSAPVGKMP